MTKKLFGGSESKAVNTSQSGYQALPAELQQQFGLLAETGEQLIQSPEDYFAPIGLTQEEQMAQYMINPENISESMSQYLNPFRDIITQDINRAFEDEYSTVAQRASEAGAFGGSAHRGAQTDVERARLDSIARAQSDQYNQAFGQYQEGILNLLGFGGLERGIEMGTSQALLEALAAYGDLLGPLLGGSTSTGFTKSSGETGIVPGIASFIPKGGAPAPA